MRLPIEKQREILRHIANSNLSNRTIGDLCVVSPTTVNVLRTRFTQSQKSWCELATLTDNEFVARLGTKSRIYKKSKVAPDWNSVHSELQKRDITLRLLHVEYLEQHSEQPDSAMGYSNFAQSYRAWSKKQRLSMRQVHKPGEKLFIDFCGRTMPICDQSTGEIKQAQIFVAVLGASGYVFAYAVPSQKISDWLLCHSKAFEFFGGVTQQLVPDNLKAAVTKNTRDELSLNRCYSEMADHYQCVINPARVRKPKDKSLAEVSVQIVQRWVLAPLRQQKFFDIHSLNRAIAQRVSLLNAKTSSKYPQSRLDRFESLDRPRLTPLPSFAFEHSRWRYSVRVPTDYHVEFEKSFYSVPHTHIQQLVDLRATSTTLEVLIAGNRIASHSLLDTPGISTQDAHRPFEHSQQSQNEPDELREWGKRLGPNVGEWVRRNLELDKNYAQGLKSTRQLRRWIKEQQNSEKIDSACEFALRFGYLSFVQLKSIVDRGADKRPNVQTTAWISSHKNIRGATYYRNVQEAQIGGEKC